MPVGCGGALLAPTPTWRGSPVHQSSTSAPGVTFVSPRSFLSFCALRLNSKSTELCYLIKPSNADEVVASLLGPLKELLAM